MSRRSAHAATLIKTAENLINLGKKADALGFLRQAVIQHPGTVEATEAESRILALGGQVPDPSEYAPVGEPVAPAASVKKKAVVAAAAPSVASAPVVQYVPPLIPSYRGSSSSSGSGGTVHVRGYTRRDGTHVAPHTRSAPRR